MMYVLIYSQILPNSISHMCTVFPKSTKNSTPPNSRILINQSKWRD